MVNSFRLRLLSSSEPVSIEYARVFMPYLSMALGRNLKPHLVTLKRNLAEVPFTAVQGLDWASALDLLGELADQGINLLLLSEEFLKWETPRDTINEDLDRFEDRLAYLQISVISVEPYSDELRGRVSDAFGTVNDWHFTRVQDVLAEMLNGFETESLCLPPGVLPYFLFDPNSNGPHKQDGGPLQALVSFQPGQFSRILRRWPMPVLPFQNWTPVDAPDTGPFPMNLTVRRRFSRATQD